MDNCRGERKDGNIVTIKDWDLDLSSWIIEGEKKSYENKEWEWHNKKRDKKYQLKKNQLWVLKGSKTHQRQHDY